MSASTSQRRGPNWTKEEILHLIEAWHATMKKPISGERTYAFGKRVFDAYEQLECNPGARSEKAVSDKRKTLPATYKFISDFNNNLKKGSTGRPGWFLLSVEEQKEIDTMNNVNGSLVDMDVEVFEALHAVLQNNDAVQPAILVSSAPVLEQDQATPHQPMYSRSFGRHHRELKQSHGEDAQNQAASSNAGEFSNAGNSQNDEITGVRKKIKTGAKDVDVANIVAVFEKSTATVLAAIEDGRQERKLERERRKQAKAVERDERDNKKQIKFEAKVALIKELLLQKY